MQTYDFPPSLDSIHVIQIFIFEAQRIPGTPTTTRSNVWCSVSRPDHRKGLLGLLMSLQGAPRRAQAGPAHFDAATLPTGHMPGGQGSTVTKMSSLSPR